MDVDEKDEKPNELMKTDDSSDKNSDEKSNAIEEITEEKNNMETNEDNMETNEDNTKSITPKAPVQMKKPGEYRPSPGEFHGPQSRVHNTENSHPSSNHSTPHNTPINKQTFYENSVFIQGIPITVGRSKLLKVFETVEGFQELILSDPIRGDRRIQYGWAKFDSQETCSKIMKEEAQGGLNGKRMCGQYYLSIFPKHPPRNRRAHIVRDVFLHPDRVDVDFRQSSALVSKLDKINKIEDHHLFAQENIEKLVSPLERINVVLEYLRRVHLCTYYESQHFLTSEFLINKYPEGFVRSRGEASGGPKLDPQPCEQKIDDWYHKKMEKNEEIHDVPWEERKRTKLAEDNTKEVKPKQKYRCALCRKAFKGSSFVTKHILNKHKPIVELYLAKEREKETLANYAKDKNKL
eukprot:UN25556